jgi:hypothetical protein
LPACTQADVLAAHEVCAESRAICAIGDALDQPDASARCIRGRDVCSAVARDCSASTR